MLYFILSMLNFSLERKSLVKLLAPKPSILNPRCSCLALLGIWELQSEEIIMLKQLGSDQFEVVSLGRWEGQYDVLLRWSRRAPCQIANVQTNAFQVQSTVLRALRCLEDCPLRKRGLSWEPQRQERSSLAESCLQIPGGLHAMWDSGPSQNITDSSPLKMVQQRAPCQAVSTPPQSRVGPKLAQPPGMG